MIFPTKPVFKRYRETLRKPTSHSDPLMMVQQLLDIDPDHRAAYLIAGTRHLEAGRTDEAEEWYWKGLERAPAGYELYAALATARSARDAGDALVPQLVRLALRKLALAKKVSASARDFFSKAWEKVPAFDPADPESFKLAVALLESQDRTEKRKAITDERLLPYDLLTGLQEQAPSAVDGELLAAIQENQAVCAPVFLSALREWGRKEEALDEKAVRLITAVVGEIGGPLALEDLLELSTFKEQVIFLHAQWAVCRMGQRFPAEALAVFRAATPSAPVSLRCGLAEQIGALPKEMEVEPALLGLMDGFSRFRREHDAAYLLVAVADSLAGHGSEDKVEEVLRHGLSLPRDAQEWIDETLSSETGFVPFIEENELNRLDIEDLCLHRLLMDDEEEDEDGGDFDEGEDFEDEEEEAPPPVIARPRPGRNDPCWCGSGKKYKKCHLEADERGTSPEPPADTDSLGDILAHVVKAARGWQSQAEQDEAFRLYFGKKRGKEPPDEESMIGFMQWYAWDYRPRSSGRTGVEEYLRRHDLALGPRERSVLEGWRDSRFGLFEVQSVEADRGVHLREVYTGDTMFVHDVTSSRELVRWDCVLTRVEKSGDRYEFSGNGLSVPRNVLPEFQDFIEEERKGEPPAEFVRANSHRLHRVIREMHQKRTENLQVVNKEGDPLEFSSATYQVLDEAAATAALRTVPGFEEETQPADSPDVRAFAWLEEGTSPRSSFGRIEIRGGRLKLECNSRRRLARGRELIEAAAGGALKHLADSYRSLKSARRRQSETGSKPEPTGIPPEVEREVLAKVQDKHYADWPDRPLPALEGRTPRAAMKTPGGRRAVLDLVHMMENGEERAKRAGRPAYDFSRLRADLGFGPDE